VTLPQVSATCFSLILPGNLTPDLSAIPAQSRFLLCLPNVFDKTQLLENDLKPESTNKLDDDRIARLLFRMALPAFIGMFVMTMYNVVDTIFIGHFVSPLGIAALSIVFPIQMLGMGIGQMTGMGGASLISRLIGAGDQNKAERTFGNAAVSNLVLSSIIMAGGLVWMDPLLTQMGTSEAIRPYAQDYMQIILICMFFRSFGMMLSSLIIAEGNGRIPMNGMLLGAVVNTVLDALFVVVLGMGMQGAALATVIGEVLTLLYFVHYYRSGKNFLHFRMRNLKFDWSLQKQIFAVGIAAFGMSVATSVSAIFVNRLCLKYGGDMAISAFGIINRVIMFALMPGIVIGMGLQPIIGFNYGAKRFDRIIRAISIAGFSATAFCTLIFFLMQFFAETLSRIFTSDEELIALTAYGSRRLFAVIFLVGFVFIGNTVFQALGKARLSFVTSISRAALFLLPAVLILPRFIGLDGIWWAYALADLLSFALTFLLLIPLLVQFRNERNKMACQKVV
jgi:putative MATE family efflux protein